jgi:uncharacterized integral membrane protein (TIGR00698 family)
VAVISYITWFFYKPISSLMWSFIYSIIAANSIGIPKKCVKGQRFVSSKLLKGTIGLLGVVTSAVIFLKVGVGVLNALLVVALSLTLSLWLGRKLGIGQKLSMLIGVGTSICGASAIAAISPAIDAEEEQVGIAIAGITLFGLLSMFLYPFLFLNTPLNNWLMQNTNVYAIWVGSGIHETAQVLAAAGALGPEVVRPAMLIKSIRIFMIGPVVLLSSHIFNRYRKKDRKSKKIVLPIFGVIFIINTMLCALLDSYTSKVALIGLIWPPLKLFLSGTLVPFLLAVAFAGVGSKVKFRNMAKLGLIPFAAVASMAIIAGVLALTLAALVAPLISASP